MNDPESPMSDNETYDANLAEAHVQLLEDKPVSKEESRSAREATLKLKQRIREKKIQMGRPVSPDVETLRQGNVVEDDATLIHEFHGKLITLHPGNIVRKSSRAIGLHEADALRVASEAGLPAPRSHGTNVTPDGRNQIFMSYIEGQTLSAIWTELSTEEKRSYAKQLQQILKAMRAVPPPADGYIGSCDGKMIREARMYMSYRAPACYGEEQFNHHLIASVHPELPQAIVKALAGRLEKMPKHRVVLTHCDLAPRNIMVKDGKITGLVDWADAGWYPEYWEYVKFFQRRAAMERDWPAYSSDIFPCEYPDELVDYIAVSAYHAM
ncbi:hypothetical protein SPBR_01904 [Sporothrix brasiliensis 5110]|uniref:Aminoglycoside phosphotransferase domain-containing protein n=1 Tax=Sporothrix brasiliensis 5110 TaxID=1398154 RepID=A0A0C2IWT5_9PEZI|nr:uncharacterized protein SPBR_01904 [Sporothrix brasiliensis 5110]KIH91210.1 hypothetical protein SPBR_01904 [Sporothrix brasiliensis 5110]